MRKTLKKIVLIALMATAIAFAAFSNGKFGVREIVYTLTLPLALVVSCKNEPDTQVNKPPVARAGEAQTVKLQNNLIITLDGSQSSDPDGTITSYVWLLKTVPDGIDKKNVIITNDIPNLGKANVTGITSKGLYVFELTVTDNNGATDSATVNVTIQESDPINQPPVARAGEAKTVKLRNNLSVTLDGSQSNDPDGTIKEYIWILKTVPNNVDKNNITITNDPVNLGKANVTGITVVGVYIFELTVTDNKDATDTSTVTITIIENVPPTATAGVDEGTLVNGKYEFDFTLPGNRSITLKGDGSDEDGNIASYAWTCTKKPDNAANPTLNATAQNPVVSGFDKLGDYEFSLKVTDNDGTESIASVVKVAVFRTASTTVGVQAVNQTGGDTKLPFTPTYTSTNTTDFPVANMSEYITYKVTAKNDSYEHTWTSGQDGFDGQVPYRAEYDGGVWTTFTQVFYDKDGNAIAGKNRVVISMACIGSFLGFGGDSNFSADLSIPGTSGISLSKKVTEGNVQ